MAEAKEMMTVDEVAELFHVHPRTVLRWIDRGLPHLRPSEGTIRVQRSKLLAWAEQDKGDVA